MKKIYCVGELLIDMVGVDHKGLKDGVHFEKKAGGAPANVAAAITKMGGNASFMGQIGDDYFGEFLHEMLLKNNIDDSLCTYGGATTIALVGINEAGERNFNFLRGSDKEYNPSDDMLEQLKEGEILHFGSATGLLDGKLKETYLKLLKLAKNRKMFISFDPNYRDTLVHDVPSFIQDCLSFIKESDFVKMSDEEVFMISGKETLEEAVEFLHHTGAKLIAVTLGEKGTYLSNGIESTIVSSIKIKQIDSTGAGDAFVGAFLSKVAEVLPSSFEEWKEICTFANKIGALTCTAYGAIDAIPDLSELDKLA